MKHSVCFIDDKIPVSQYSSYFNETDIISGSIIKYLLSQETTIWDDSIVKILCERLVREPQKWTISAFTSPAFYRNYVDTSVFAPEIVIYDWDYNFGAGDDSSKNYLLKFLQESYTMIFVFSGSDRIDEIKQIIADDEFNRFGDRISVIDKHDDDSVGKMFSQITQKEQSNFSFAYGSEVVRNSNKAINQVLSDISLLSVDDFLESIGAKLENNKYISSNKDFIDAIIPRYKSILRNSVISNEITKEKKSTPDIDNIRKVWSYRIYDRNDNNNVQMGDIVKNASGEYFLVLSSDCHLTEFWKKNIGFLSIIPLLKIDSDMTKNRINLKWKKKSIDNIKFTSLTNNAPISILPCVPIDEDNLYDLIIITKSITTIEITKENDTDKELTYKHLTDYVKVASISDPFKSPLIQHVFDNISGYGCPDYPDILQEDLRNKVKEVLL